MSFGGPLLRSSRAVEWVLAAYFTYTTVLALVLPLHAELRVRTLAANVCVALFLACFSVARWRDALWALVVRDWGTLGMALLAYREMGWFAPDIHDHTLESAWVAWDRLLLGEFGVKSLIEAAGPLVPAVLELSYVLVYALAPFCMAMIYIYRRRTAAPYFLLLYILGLYVSYMQFPFWPSEPPRTVFPHDLEPAPGILRDWNLRILSGAGIHTSVFPSAHVSGAFASAFAMWRIFSDKPWLRRGVLAYACTVSVATVYGRYHYAVDAFAGLAMAVVAMWVSRFLRHLRGCGPSCDPPKIQPCGS